MPINSIVSFLPSATELLYEFGEEAKITGVTHECLYPKGAKSKPIVINSVVDSNNLSSNEIDQTTCQLLKEGKDIFVLNEENLKRANPDLIISQETCEVCAAYTNQVNKAVQILDKKPILHSMDPHNVDEIIDSVIKLGEILGKQEKASQIVESLKIRIQRIEKIRNGNCPKILAIEWIEPFFTAGHWVPQMIEIAGGKNMISKTGEHSRRLTIEEIREADPDTIILMPCGFDVKRTVQEYNQILKNNQEWNSLRAVKGGKVFAVDANSFFSKPSIRTITGIEILTKIIQLKNNTNIDIPTNSFLQIK
ncbi:cobalamin-binding protein [Nitrosopumilus sp. K4]|uniref:cobalamin-binding protein n=1 Tax=Nitrosopumilus sp. K4 TaxID=2795383 RepID=UPI001BAA2C38|nr:cobalamin-binding protein [Nitrosopumilus sp. K4]QUC63860.1 cobalamin-binding protein [Nitrosopumilus sp. K4]